MKGSGSVQFVMIAIIGALASCGTGQGRPPPEAKSPEQTASALGMDWPRLSNCSLRNSSVESKTHQYTPAGGPPGPTTLEGSCWADAECLTDAGDDVEAVVSMVCGERGQCACRLRQKMPYSKDVEFQFPATCTSDEAVEKLMLDRCMRGMQMAAPSPGEPSVERHD